MRLILMLRMLFIGLIGRFFEFSTFLHSSTSKFEVGCGCLLSSGIVYSSWLHLHARQHDSYSEWHAEIS
jgi:hypothetical protein